MKNNLTRILLGSLVIVNLGSLNAQAQFNNLNWYDCYGIYESVSSPGMTTPAPGDTGSVCGPNVEYAQEIATSWLSGASNTPYGYKVVAQCSLNWQYQNYCMTQGLQ
jgi:hypothetical protein